MSYFIVLLRVFYYLLPRLIREQYSDSIEYYSILLNKSIFYKYFLKKNKVDNNEKSDVISVLLEPDLEKLSPDNFDLLVHNTNRKSEVEPPKLWVDGALCYRKKLHSKLPDVKVVRVKNVMVLGGTDAVIKENRMYHQELSLMDSNHDMKQPNIFVKNDLGYSIEYKLSNRRINNDIIAVSLLKEHSVNYYHWVTEVVPKLIEILPFLVGEKRHINIFVDKGQPKQNMEVAKEILSTYGISGFEFVAVNKGEIILCSELLYCSPLWVSLDNTHTLPNPIKEFFVSKENLEKTRSTILHELDDDNQFEVKSRLVYLQRANTKLRKITNILEVERLLYKYGFDFVDPGSLTFVEQKRIFSQAEIVIGASGAAFTNLLFMPENSTAISFYPSAQSTNYYIFQPIADVSKVNLIHFLTHPEDNSTSVHGDASVNINELKVLLDKMISC